MSRIDNLVKELCPNGVKYLELYKVIKWNKRFSGVNKEWQSEIVSTKSNVSAQELKSLALDSGNIKLLSTGNFDGYTDSSVYAGNVDDLEVITIPSGGTANIKYYNGQFINSGNIIGTSANCDKYYLKYIYYCLLNKNKLVQSFFRGSSVQHPDMKQIIQIKIPVPPMKIQKEVVSILDRFGELKAVLEAELESRKSQYEFWRGKLFDFEEKVEYKRLDELFPFIRNGFVGTVTPFFTEKENGVRYLQGTNIHNGIISDNEEYYVTKDFHEKHIKNELKSDDILMVQSGHIGECAVVGEKYKGCNCHALIIMSRGENVSSKFIVHYFHTIKGYNSLNPAITGGTIKHVLAGKIGKIKVPCPPLDVQERIVNILDRFDTLVNDITVGLPAEIELRRKQYEYYRNKLLSFEELSVSE